jgi:hypothetical protein
MKYMLLTLSILACLCANAQKTLYRYYAKGYWGVTDEKLNIVITPQYDKIHLTQYPYIYVYKGDKCGLTDIKGNLIIPCEYEPGLKIVTPAMAAIHRNGAGRNA